MATWIRFEKCPGCGYDIATGEGERSCHYADCPYLPQELNVLCPQCVFNFATEEGNPSCEDPATCEHGTEARANVANLRAWERARHPASR